MRRGWSYQRCGRCGTTVKGDECDRCRGRTFTWTDVVDIAPVGFPRHQIKKGGFASEADAVAAMSRSLLEVKTGRHQDPETLTTARYLSDWLIEVASGSSIRPTTAKAYDVAIRVHISPRLGRLSRREPLCAGSLGTSPAFSQLLACERPSPVTPSPLPLQARTASPGLCRPRLARRPYRSAG